MKKRGIALLLLCSFLLSLSSAALAGEEGKFLVAISEAEAKAFRLLSEKGESAEGMIVSAESLTVEAESLAFYREANGDRSVKNCLALLRNMKGKSLLLLGEEEAYYQVQFRGLTGYVEKAALKESAYDPFPFEAVALDKTINMRTEPNADAERVEKFSKVKGESFTILGISEDGEWYLAEKDGKEGYVRKMDFCAFYGDASGYSITPYAELTKGEEDVWGHIKVEGTFIDYPIYCNALNKEKTDYYYNKDYFSLFTMSAEEAPIAVLMGHNTRKRAGTEDSMHHDLHHLQNVYLGIERCEYCDADVAGTDTKIQLSYNGCEDWTLCCFYEVDKENLPSEEIRAAIKHVNALNSGLEGAEKEAWIQQQLLLAYQYGMILDTDMDPEDKIMIIITCADKSGTDNQSFYLVLRGNE